MAGFPPASAVAAPKTTIVKNAGAITNAGLGQANAQMFGLAAQFTPASTGKVRVVIEGFFTNLTINDGCGAQGSFGTGVPPVANAAKVGTLFGAGNIVCTAAIAGQFYNCTLEDIITGLTLGTTYWFDIQVWAITGGTGEAAQLTATIYEVS